MIGLSTDLAFTKQKKKFPTREIICHIFRIELYLILNQDSLFLQNYEGGARGGGREEDESSKLRTAAGKRCTQ